MDTPTERKPKVSRKNLPPGGPLTRTQLEDRRTFAISTFRNCQTKEQQLQAIMTYCRVKRLQATRIWDEAAAELRQAHTDYQKNYAVDQYQFLVGMRSDPTVKPAERLTANKQLQDVFGPPKELKISGTAPTILVATQVNLLSNEKAIEAALALEAALASAEPLAANGTQEKAIPVAPGLLLDGVEVDGAQ